MIITKACKSATLFWARLGASLVVNTITAKINIILSSTDNRLGLNTMARI